MSALVLTAADHAAHAAYHQAQAACWADKQALERDTGEAVRATFFQGKASASAKQARFHLFRALDLAAEAGA